jgi:hypothetical protein
VETLTVRSPSLLLWLVAAAAMLSSTVAFGVLIAGMPIRPVVAVDAETPAKGLARHRSRCAECGWIESIRETEITVRLRDGTSRVIVDAHRGTSRLGERVMIIDGTE